jgi:hypothetical protein
MPLTREQVQQLAPDAASLAAARKLTASRHWSDLGRSAVALWGRCHGSAIYQVEVDLTDVGYHCSCPSRKFPCKHVLALLSVAVESPGTLPETPPPGWVEAWLQRRRVRDEQRAARVEAPSRETSDPQARQRRADQRESRVAEGIDRLDRWLEDLVRTGLAGVETRPPAFWGDQAKRLTDAQAPGLASRLARLADIPRSGSDWTDRLIGELGRLRLLTHAYRRLGELDDLLQADIRQMIGWTLDVADLERVGERVADTWAVAGQSVEDDDRIRIQRSWLVGRRTQRLALVLQFAAGDARFAEAIVPGTEQSADLLFYPGAFAQRARLSTRRGAVTRLDARLPGAASVAALLDGIALALSRQPWLATFGCILHDVALAHDGPDAASGSWFVRDGTGAALPLAGRHWPLLALTAGGPCDIAGEWDGRHLRVLAYMTGPDYHLVS